MVAEGDDQVSRAEQYFESRLSREGRVSVPAALRVRLDLHVGDRVRFVLDDHGVHLVNPRLLLEEVWANNPSGRRGVGVAARRREDRASEEAALRREADATALTDEEVESRMLAVLSGAPAEREGSR